MNCTQRVISLTILIFSQSIQAQDIPVDVLSENDTHSGPATEIITSPDTTSPQEKDDAAQLSEGEQRIRTGIIMLGSLHNILAGIQDKDTAENAVAPLMRLNNELNLWAQSFTALPPMNETEQAVCEDRYLPIIKKINYSIKSQGERLAAAEYYGSMNLPAVLVKLAILNQ